MHLPVLTQMFLKQIPPRVSRVPGAKGHAAAAGALCHPPETNSPISGTMVKDHCLENIPSRIFSFPTTSSYDPRSPIAARRAAAIDAGMKNVDSMLAAKYAKTRKPKGQESRAAAYSPGPGFR